jgi:nicotinamidase-related amidase
MALRELPIPDHFNPENVGDVWRVPYQERAEGAALWARKYDIPPVSSDKVRIAMLLVDVQNTFCIPGFELYVGGRSGMGAVDDNRRLCRFIYRNLGAVSHIIATMDTHQTLQIFHAAFLVNDKGEHPEAFSQISLAEIENGRWQPSPDALKYLGIDREYGQRYLLHYARSLKKSGKYDLTVWPYHAMLGGIGHAMASSVEEAVFFHSLTRACQPEFRIKGGNPLTEHYSVFGPEVKKGPDGEIVAGKDEGLVERLLQFDAVIIAGQAKSHCVAWTIEDLLAGLRERKATSDLAGKIYLLEDCTSPVVIPGGSDYSDTADDAFRRFAGAGMHVVRSDDSLDCWAGMPRP